MDKILAYCDGGCRNNQRTENIGGWGVVLKYKDHLKELKGAQKNTTNNIMELTSCIKALEAIKRKDIPIVIISDSAYVVNAFKQGWISNWQAKGWKTAKKEPVKNKEVWLQLINLVDAFEDISFKKVKGHASNEGNNRADELANLAMSEIE